MYLLFGVTSTRDILSKNLTLHFLYISIKLIRINIAAKIAKFYEYANNIPKAKMRKIKDYCKYKKMNAILKAFFNIKGVNFKNP